MLVVTNLHNVRCKNGCRSELLDRVLPTLGLWMRSVVFLITMIVAGPLSANATEPNAFQFSFKAIEGGPLPLSRFDGKVLLIVNTASYCGFTRQYGELQNVWENYRDRGLIVIGVPSNDFGAQEPGSAEKIKAFCEVNFDIDFPLADKTKVKGPKAHPFYRWARDRLGKRSEPSWNFHKYLVNRHGNLVASFPPRVSPQSIKVLRAIDDALHS